MRLPYHLFIILAFITLFYFSAKSQDIANMADSVFIEKEKLDLTDISRKSVELTLEARDMVDKVMNDGNIEKLKRNNELIIKKYTELLKPEAYVKLAALSDRNLNAKLNYWQLNLKTISNQRIEITNSYKDLDDKATSLIKEVDEWKSSEQVIMSESLSNTINLRLNNIESMIDSTILIFNSRRTELLNLLDNITVLELEIDLLIKKIGTAIKQKQEHILNTDQQTFFSVLSSKETNWKIPESIWKYHANNLDFLIHYMIKNIDRLIFHIILIIFLIVLFVRTSKLKTFMSESKNIYVKRLNIILSRPISAAIIIGLFASILIYPYRPLLFQDLSRFLVVFPIVILLTKISTRVYHKYIYAFAVMVFMHIIYINLPVSHILSRITLLLISIIELVFFSYFLIELKGSTDIKRNIKTVVKAISGILILFSLFSLYGNLVGKVNFSVYFVEVVIGTFLIVVLIIFSLVVVIGLTVLLLESNASNKVHFIKNYRYKIETKLIALFRLTAFIALLYFVLDLLKIQQIVTDAFRDFFTDVRSIGSVEFTYGKILIFIAVIWLSVIIGKFISIILEGDVLRNLKLKKGLPHTIALMVKYTLVSAGIFLAISAVGFPLDSLTVIIGAFGVGIGFGLQNIFNNLVSGLILLFERPIQIGDTIEVGTMIGKVNSIGIRSSNIKSLEGAEIIVPNGNLISNDVINWTLSDDRRRIEVIVGVSYNSDPHKVKDILLRILEDHADIIKDPEPSVLFQDLGESSLDFRMLFWTKEFNKWIQIKSEIIFSVFDKLKESGIEIPFPQRDLHVRSIEQSLEIKK